MKKNATKSAYTFTRTSSEGLTKGEYFAAMAMQGYIAGNCAWAHGGVDATPHPIDAAKKAVEYADALLKELEERQHEQ